MYFQKWEIYKYNNKILFVNGFLIQSRIHLVWVIPRIEKMTTPAKTEVPQLITETKMASL